MADYIKRLEVSKADLAPRNKSDTDIQKFYSGKNVFITGGTGFLGKCLIEKLLWSCPDIGNIYLMLREKKGKDLNSRLDELFESSCFARLKDSIDHYKDKIRIISGDCGLLGLGISTQDRAELLKEVNVVFHVAATVRFHEALNTALALNVRATQDVLEMCKEMKSLISYIHVSTAYSHCYNSNMGEHFYETPVDPLKLLKFVETADQQIIDAITPKLVGKWPNTYTFSKALAEDYLRQCGPGLPLGIFRPSIVISSYKEPLPRWVDNWYGVNGYVTAVGAGLLRVMRGGSSKEANVVPVDMVTNAMIASAWDVADRFKEISNLPKVKPTSRDIRIYNFVLADNPVKWFDWYYQSSKNGERVPPSRAMWYRCLIMTENKYMHAVNKFFLHKIPALFFDLAAICTGNKPQISSMYNRIDKMEDVTMFFTTREWTFANHNTLKLIAKMSEADKKLYACDIRKLDWKDYLECYYLGVRRYLLKDEDSTIPKAQIKYRRLYWLHRTVQLIIFIMVLKGSYKTGMFLYNTINRFKKISYK